MTPPRLDFRILIATHNAGKFRELQSALSALSYKFVSLSDFPDVTPVPETGSTYQENAVLKALGYAKQTGICALADDSGLEVDALGGAPGLYSARFAGEDASDAERITKLLAALSTYPGATRSARFVCSMALAGWPDQMATVKRNPQVLRIVEARCEGTIAPSPRGKGGFGFDPIFVPQGYIETFGELPSAVKARTSHRALASARMHDFLEQWSGQLKQWNGQT